MVNAIAITNLAAHSTAGSIDQPSLMSHPISLTVDNTLVSLVRLAAVKAPQDALSG
jgi:hypothetical protein